MSRDGICLMRRDDFAEVTRIRYPVRDDRLVSVMTGVELPAGHIERGGVGGGARKRTHAPVQAGRVRRAGDRRLDRIDQAMGVVRNPWLPRAAAGRIRRLVYDLWPRAIVLSRGDASHRDS